MNKHTKKIIKIGVMLGGLAAINTAICIKADKLKDNYSKDYSEYDWMKGKVRYVKSGSGKPILLIHNINPDSSSDEWRKIIPILAGSRTVYAPDMLGCGQSDKPFINYNNSIYMNLINDFLKDVIGEKTDVVCLGGAVGPVLHACANKNDLIDNVIIINPDPVWELEHRRNTWFDFEKFVIDLPIIGTVIYNIEFSKFLINYKINNLYLTGNRGFTEEEAQRYYYNAHSGHGMGKALFSSIIGNRFSSDMKKISKRVDNAILLIIGRNAIYAKDNAKNYLRLFPDAKTIIIKNTRILAPLDNHLATAKAILEFNRG